MAELNNDDDSDGELPSGIAGGSGERERSGSRYPFYSLDEAFAFASAIQKCGGNEVLEDDLLKYLNLSRTTKSWVYKLSTAREFGLVDRKGQKAEARITITDLGRRLLLPGDAEELSATKIAVALTPPLYKKLFARYKGGPVPQVRLLANLLVREHKIVESVSEQAAGAFIATAKYAGLVNGPSDILDDQKPGQRKAEERPPELERRPPAPMPPAGGQILSVPADFIAHTFPLRRDLTITIPLPISLTAKDVNRLKNWMDTLVIEDDPPGPAIYQVNPGRADERSAIRRATFDAFDDEHGTAETT